MKCPIFIDNDYYCRDNIAEISYNHILKELNDDNAHNSYCYINLGNKLEFLSKLEKMDLINEYLKGYSLHFDSNDDNRILVYNYTEENKEKQVIIFDDLNNYDFDNKLDVIFNKPKIYSNLYDFYKHNKILFNDNKKKLINISYIVDNNKLFKSIKDVFSKLFAVTINESINYIKNVSFLIDKDRFIYNNYTNEFGFIMIIDINFSGFYIELDCKLNKESFDMSYKIIADSNNRGRLLSNNIRLMLLEISSNIDKMKSLINDDIKNKHESILKEINKKINDEKSVDKYIKYLVKRYENDYDKQIEILKNSLLIKAEVLFDKNN